MGVMPNVKKRRYKCVSCSAAGSNEDNVKISFRLGNSNLLSYDQSITIVDNDA